jgi:hypothetical protein
MATGKVIELVELVIGRSEVDVPRDHIAFVLMVLDSHNLLREFPGTPEEYHERVQQAWRDALFAVTGHSGDAGSSGSIAEP